MTVRAARIGDILELRRDQVFVDLSSSYIEIGVRSFGRGIFIKEPITGMELGDKRVFRIRANDLVVSNVFAWEGAVAVATEEHDCFIGSHRFMTWVPVCDRMVDVRYLQHFFTSDRGLSLLRQASPGSAGRNRTLSIKNFETIEVPLPPIDDQRRIATHLDRIAHAARVPRRSYLFFRTMKQRVLNHVADTIRLPVPLRAILATKNSDPVLLHASYRIAGVYSFGRGLLDRGPILGQDTKYVSFTQLDEHDVVYSKLGAFEGAVAVVDDAFAGSCVSPEFPVFTVSGDVDPGFLKHQLTSPAFEALLASSSAGVGARQKRIHPSAFLGLSILLPPRDVQQQCAHTLDKIDGAWALSQKIDRLSAAILPSARNEIFNALR